MKAKLCTALLGGLLLLLGVCTSLLAQNKVYYVSPEGDDAHPGTAASPFETVYKALGEAQEMDTIRLAVGRYLISDKAGSGELFIPTGVTVQGGFQVQSGGSVLNTWTYEGKETILQGDSTCRIARVAGTLEYVTVVGGLASQNNGGGLYVESGGTVRNCIVHSNVATGLVPKVGDILLKDGSFLVAKNFRQEMISEVEGIVFWINPMENAPVGQQGKIIALKPVETSSGMITISSSDQTAYLQVIQNYAVSDKEAAFQETDGELNTDRIAPYDFTLAYQVRQKGPKWYVPAAGELMGMLAEWMVVNETFKMMRTKLTSEDDQTEYLGEDSWGSTGIMSSSTLYFVSSSSFAPANLHVWVLNDKTGHPSLQNTPILTKIGIQLRLLKTATYPVRKF